MITTNQVNHNKQLDMFHWPIITKEDEDAVIDVLRNANMSGIDISQKFEAEFATWIGAEFALSTCNGTAAIQEAMFAIGLGEGDEIICPALTYWATIMPATQFRSTPIFADVDPETLCIDPNNIECHITPKTKAIIVTHQFGHPCDMDAIMKIASDHQLKVIEDVSHAQGGLYKGKKLGTIGDIGAMSMMAGKSFAIGEGGMLVTNNRNLWERAIAYGHYRRSNQLTDPALKKYAGVALGGVKHRINQTCSAMGRVQLRYYDERIAEIQKSMNYFWDCLKDTPGIRAHRVDKDSHSTMGGWYSPVGRYIKEELNGLNINEFAKEVTSAGSICSVYSGQGKGHHTHAYFQEAYPLNSKIRNAALQLTGQLPIAQSSPGTILDVPWFKHFRKDEIKQHADIWINIVKKYRI